MQRARRGRSADAVGAAAPMVVVVSGVAGSGKSTVGEAVADALGWDYIEGDASHPPENVEKMSRGEPLDDRDRAPWLAALRAEIEARLEAGPPAVLAASALKARYRRELRVDHPRVLLVFLEISPELARERLTTRGGHFFGADLVASQFEALERPEHALVLPAEWSVPHLVEAVERAARSPGGLNPSGRDPAGPSPSGP